MGEQQIIILGSILILGGGAQWLAWRFHLPSILLLLVFGFVAGPVTGFLDPDAMLGEGIFAFTALAVAVVLFEGGLSLRFADIKGHGAVVRNLISLGVVVSIVLTALAARFFLGFDWKLAVLFGAVLSVSGPTVVVPLLRHIRPAPRIGSILLWEGILVDSVGAMAAILVFEFAVRATGADAVGATVAILKMMLIGTAVGLAMARALIILLERYWIPDFLHSVAALIGVVAVYIVSNALQHESGLFAVTIMGIALINQRSVSIKHIVEFKETLRTLLISSLFIVLAARVRLSDFAFVSWGILFFLVVLVMVIRPAVVAVSTRSSSLTFRDKAFLASVYPRGIVAAAVASIFALRLAEIGYPGAEAFAPAVFTVIAGTVAFYGFAGLPLARLLGIAVARPQGFLIIGGHPWALAVARALHDEGLSVLVVDNQWPNISAARIAGLQTYFARSFSDFISDEVELGGIGRLLALTPSYELNSLVTLHYLDVFGRKDLYQISCEGIREAEAEPTAPHLCGRYVFGREVSFDDVSRMFDAGASVRVTKLTPEFDYQAFTARNPDALPFCIIDEVGRTTVFAADADPKPRPGQKIVAIIQAPVSETD